MSRSWQQPGPITVASDSDYEDWLASLDVRAA